VSGNRFKATIIIACGFVFNVSGYCPNDYSSSAIDEKDVPALRETIVRDCSESDGGYSIGWRSGDRSKQSAATSRSFEWNSNVTDVSDMQEEKHVLHSTSTDAGT
jgi:hypothetical protein